MATTKKPKTSTKAAPKTMDVSRPETTAPDASGRPIIVGNRSIIQDPMMSAGSSTASELDEPTTSPVMPARDKKIIEPTASTKPKLPSTKAKEAPAESNVTVPEDTADKTEVTAPEVAEDRVVPQLVKNALKEKQASTEDASDKSPAGEAETATDQADQVESTESNESNDQSAEGDSTVPASSEELEAAPPVSDASESGQSGPAPVADTSSDEADKQDEDGTTDKPDETALAEAEAAKEAEREERHRELIAEKTYFLPIKNAKATSRTYALVVLLLIAVAAAAAYVMMPELLR